jgi:hypothetical protein
MLDGISSIGGKLMGGEVTRSGWAGLTDRIADANRAQAAGDGADPDKAPVAWKEASYKPGGKKAGGAAQAANRPGPKSAPVASPVVTADPGALLFYTEPGLAVIARCAGVPNLLAISHSEAANDDPATKEAVRKFLQEFWRNRMPELSKSELFLNMAVDALMAKREPSARAFLANGRPITGNRSPEKAVAGIIDAPGPDLSANYIRKLTGLNIAGDQISQALLREAAFLITAHEASHIKLRSLGLADSEYGAETGAQRCLGDNAEFLPILAANPDIAQGFWRGMDALGDLFKGRNEQGHGLIAPLRFSDRNLEANRYTELAEAERDVVGKITMRMYQNGHLHPTPQESLAAAWLADKTGFRAAVLEAAKSKMLSREAVVVKMWNFFSQYGSDDGGQQGFMKGFTKEFGISEDALPGFVKAGEPFAAPDAFRRERQAARTIPLEMTKLIDPKDPFVQGALEAVEQLYREGAFDKSPAQKAFAENLLAGARFYGLRA